MVRCTKVPPDCSVECWSKDTMLAPAAAKKALTAATRPGWSGQRNNNRPTSLTGNGLCPTSGYR